MILIVLLFHVSSNLRKPGSQAEFVNRRCSNFLLNSYLHFPLGNNTGCSWPSASQYAMLQPCLSSPELVRDEKIIESNEWKRRRNVGICAGERCLKSWLLTLAMLFRAFSLSKSMVGLELRLYFSSEWREGFRELWSYGRTRYVKVSKRATRLEIWYSVRLTSFELVEMLSLRSNWRLQTMSDQYDVSHT